MEYDYCNKDNKDVHLISPWRFRIAHLKSLIVPTSGLVQVFGGSMNDVVDGPDRVIFKISLNSDKSKSHS